MKSTVIMMKILVFLAALTLLSGCIFVKGSSEKVERTSAVSPQPLVPMSDEIVRSDVGDMLAYLPEKWFFINVDEKVPSGVFAVAVNPEYTLSLVFSEVRKDESLEELFRKEGVIGLARASFQRREKKTAGVVKLVGKISADSVGLKQFGLYEFSGDNGVTLSKAAVFRSSLGNYYECSLVEMPFTGRKIPPRTDNEKIFRSLLVVLDF